MADPLCVRPVVRRRRPRRATQGGWADVHRCFMSSVSCSSPHCVVPVYVCVFVCVCVRDSSGGPLRPCCSRSNRPSTTSCARNSGASTGTPLCAVLLHTTRRKDLLMTPHRTPHKHAGSTYLDKDVLDGGGSKGAGRGDLSARSYRTISTNPGLEDLQ